MANMNCPIANRYQAQYARGRCSLVPSMIMAEHDRPTNGTTKPLPWIGGTHAYNANTTRPALGYHSQSGGACRRRVRVMLPALGLRDGAAAARGRPDP